MLYFGEECPDECAAACDFEGETCAWNATSCDESAKVCNGVKEIYINIFAVFRSGLTQFTCGVVIKSRMLFHFICYKFRTGLH